MKRLFSILMLTSVLAIPAAATAPRAMASNVPPALEISAANYCADSEEMELLKLVNDYRTANGLSALTLSPSLGAAARHHSDSMATFNYFDPSHDLHFEGINQDETVTWQDNIASHGYPDNTHTSRAENLAAGYETASETLAQWQSSPSHDEHLLDGKYQAIGIGRAFNPDAEYRWYWTVTFGSLSDDTAAPCETASTYEGTPEPGTELSIVQSGRNGSSSDSSAAYDGDEATSWYTTKSRPPMSAYVWFDFGDTRTLSKIEYLFTEAGGSDAFEIQISLDREEWTTIAETGGPEIGEWETFEWSGEARYVRFWFSNPERTDVLGHLAEVRFFA